MRLQLEVVGVLSLGVGGAAWCDAIWPLAVCVVGVAIAMLVDVLVEKARKA